MLSKPWQIGPLRCISLGFILVFLLSNPLKAFPEQKLRRISRILADGGTTSVCSEATSCKECKHKAVDVEDDDKAQTCRWVSENGDDGTKACSQMKSEEAGIFECPAAVPATDPAPSDSPPTQATTQSTPAAGADQSQSTPATPVEPNPVNPTTEAPAQSTPGTSSPTNQKSPTPGNPAPSEPAPGNPAPSEPQTTPATPESTPGNPTPSQAEPEPTTANPTPATPQPASAQPKSTPAPAPADPQTTPATPAEPQPGPTPDEPTPGNPAPSEPQTTPATPESTPQNPTPSQAEPEPTAANPTPATPQPSSAQPKSTPAPAPAEPNPGPTPDEPTPTTPAPQPTPTEPSEPQPTAKVEKPVGDVFEENDDVSIFDAFGKEMAGGMILVVLLFLWTKCCRGPDNSTKSGLPTRAPPQSSILGQPGATNYQGVALDDEDEDPDDWGWDDNNGDSFGAGDMELPKMGSPKSSPTEYKPSSVPQRSVAPIPIVSPVRTHTPASPMAAASTLGLKVPAYKKKAPAPKPKPKPADDIFSEMGLAAQPNFAKPTKSLGATRLPVDDSWGDDDDLDDLLDD